MDLVTLLVHRAIADDDVDALDALFSESGSDPSSFRDGKSAYHVAVEYGSINCLLSLLKFVTVDHHARSPTLFITPVEYGRRLVKLQTIPEIMKRKIQSCVDLLVHSSTYKKTTLETLVEFPLPEDRNVAGIVKDKDLAALKSYLEKDPSRASSYPYPLFLCVEYEFYEGIDLLVDTYYVDVEDKNIEGLAPLAYAAIHKNKDMCVYLMSKGASSRSEILPGVFIEDAIKVLN